jgi:hypothetical protein
MNTMTKFTYPAFALFAFVCIGLSPKVRATCQEGCLGSGNTVLGDEALHNAGGFANTAVGSLALFYNTAGFGNTAVGSNALIDNTSGFDNTAIGFNALFYNMTGNENTATGNYALFTNSTGDFNTANGVQALQLNTAGNNNTAVGYLALELNTAGDNNTATGGFTLNMNETGRNNTATGFQALYNNTTGNNNTASGVSALYNNTTGNNNIAVGLSAGYNLTTGGNNIDIGNTGVAGEAGIIRIGTAGSQVTTFLAGITETPLAQGVALAVGITADGQLGVRASSARFKEAIKPMDKASEAIFSLQPVTFRYKKALDPTALPQFGLVAEEVAKVDPDLVARDAQGKPFTVRYDEVNAMLLNEFLKEHRKVEALEAAMAKMQATIEKVSARIELSKGGPRIVANEP